MAMTTKIGFFEATTWERQHIRRYSQWKGNVDFFPVELTKDTLQKAMPYSILSVFIYSAITAEVIASLPNLKLIVTRSTGFDHVDLAACKKRGITVCNVPSYGDNTVAEHTFALILSLSRNVHKAYVRTVRGDYSLEGLRGFDLKGRTIGVIGGGRIGMHVVRMARGFGMKTMVFDVKQNTFMAEVLDFEYVSLNDLLAASDIITLHAPYNPKTHHIINRNNVKKIKKGAILINTARGGLVETHALLEALEKGILSGAGLDVIEGEELIKEERQVLSHKYPPDKLETVIKSSAILHREDVVFTPHIGFYSSEALARIMDVTVENIESFKKGTPTNAVG